MLGDAEYFSAMFLIMKGIALEYILEAKAWIYYNDNI
jgi:hypothetical protein